MVNKKVLWKVPVYSIIAGLISFRLNVYLFGRFTLTTLPDGSITINDTATLILYGLILAVVVLLGGLYFFREMTKKEIFVSASILVVLQILLLIVQWKMNATTGLAATFFLYWAETLEWSNFIYLVLIKWIDNLWICVFMGCFAPYLFIPFGKKES